MSEGLIYYITLSQLMKHNVHYKTFFLVHEFDFEIGNSLSST